MSKQKDFASFELAKQLKKIGFNEPCGHSYTQYTSDFVYDGDPDHPESHKKGDIHIYDFYNTNDENGKTTYSMPHLYDVQAWFRTRGIIIHPEYEEHDDEKGWTSNIYHIETGMSQYSPKLLKEYEDALQKGCMDAIRWYVKPNKTDSNKR
jgi:hypothetical protein